MTATREGGCYQPDFLAHCGFMRANPGENAVNADDDWSRLQNEFANSQLDYRRARKRRAG